MTAHTGEDVEKREHSLIAGETANLYNCCKILCCVSQGKLKSIYLQTQLYQSWAHIHGYFVLPQRYFFNHVCYFSTHKSLKWQKKKLKCLSADEWTKKMWSIYSMKYYSAVKKLKFKDKWMELKNRHLQWGKTDPER